jgi:SAM-dependent methyltransferase
VLEELLRVVGSGFVVLVEDAESAKNPRSQGASFSDGLRGMFPNLPLLELVALDPCTLTLSCAAIISRDERRLVELAKAVTRHNIHTRVFGVSRSALGADQAGSAASVGSVVAAAASGGKPQLSPLAATRAGFPPEFDEDVYRSLHRDLAKFSGTALREHYMRHGESEGRRSHVLKDREAFAALLSPELDVLEIGPLFSPLLRGPRVRYFELFDTPNLRSRAVAKGHPPELVPDIHYVSPTADLSIVDAKFDAVISSHVIEHQPDLLAHLDIVRGLLRPGGLYFALIPDKEHCFDHFMAPSTIADLLDAHVDKRTRHTLRSQVAYAALRTHNDSARHWRGDHGPVVASAANVARAVDEYVKVGARYEDVHAWYFTPTSFRGLLELSRQLGETEFSVLRLYPALTDSNEFWAILQAGA